MKVRAGKRSTALLNSGAKQVYGPVQVTAIV
jgi:hypothetical protein